MASASMTDDLVARTFAIFEAAAAEGRRAPENGTFGIRSDVATMLAARGDIRILIYGHNYRVVEILTGPHQGKRTLAPKGGGRLWKIIDREGSRRLHARRSSDAKRREREGYKLPLATTDIVRSLGVRPVPPAEVLFDRECRMNAPRTPNVIVLGDPEVPRWHSNADRR